jgi:asparagine synthase (glutamine-hydrolysing)
MLSFLVGLTHRYVTRDCPAPQRSPPLPDGLSAVHQTPKISEHPVCGILALLDVNCSDTTARRALDELSHRGPDACGTWTGNGVWLGCRRLAITDPDNRSNQPLIDDASGVALVFNGEIYNFRDIRRQLPSRRHGFLTDCDTEVVLRAYLHWGAACLERFNGMWAFVLFDPRSETLFYSRDRLGVKPLYYAYTASGIALASEPKALIALDPSLEEPDYKALARLLVAKRLYGDGHTFYSNIYAVPPASYGSIRRGVQSLPVSHFWRVADDCDPREHGDDDRHFGRLLEAAVRVRLDCEQDTGLALSGGLDSTAVLAASRRSSGPRFFRAYTSTYTPPTPLEDRPWARKAAQLAALEITEVPAPANQWLDTLRKIVWHMDGPGYTPAVYPLWKLMEAAHLDGIKVMLDGQGADELLAGYPRHASAAVIDAVGGHGLLTDQGRLATLSSVTCAGAAASGWLRLAQDVLLESLASARRLHRWSTTLLPALQHDFAVAGVAAEEKASRGELLRTRLLRDFTSDVLPGFLQYGDAISMAHGIETRQPFLDIDLVEHCLRLDTTQKITTLGTKTPVRRYLISCGQAEIAHRSRKQGYPTPAAAWMRDRDGALLREVLLDRAARIANFTVARDLERLITRFTLGHAALGESLYSLIATELWLQHG